VQPEKTARRREQALEGEGPIDLRYIVQITVWIGIDQIDGRMHALIEIVGSS